MRRSVGREGEASDAVSVAWARTTARIAALVWSPTSADDWTAGTVQATAWSRYEAYWWPYCQGVKGINYLNHCMPLTADDFLSLSQVNWYTSYIDSPTRCKLWEFAYDCIVLTVFFVFFIKYQSINRSITLVVFVNRDSLPCACHRSECERWVWPTDCYLLTGWAAVSVGGWETRLPAAHRRPRRSTTPGERKQCTVMQCLTAARSPIVNTMSLST